MPSKWDELSFTLHDVRWNEPEVVGHFLRVIKGSVPPGIVMPVPRCDSCRRWARPDPQQDGICTLWKGNKIVVTTSADYGCVRWEGK